MKRCYIVRNIHDLFCIAIIAKSVKHAKTLAYRQSPPEVDFSEWIDVVVKWHRTDVDLSKFEYGHILEPEDGLIYGIYDHIIGYCPICRKHNATLVYYNDSRDGVGINCIMCEDCHYKLVNCL